MSLKERHNDEEIQEMDLAVLGETSVPLERPPASSMVGSH
jgi:hypothetical protein